MNATIAQSDEPSRLSLHAALELDGVLDALAGQLRTLLELAERKLAAMRRADPAAIHECTLEETDCLREHYRMDRRLRAVLARFAQRLPDGTLSQPRVAEVAGRLAEPLASRIQAKSACLRPLAEKLQRQNQLASQVAQNLHGHIRAVFAEVADAQQKTVGYGPAGRHEKRASQRLVDAVG